MDRFCQMQHTDVCHPTNFVRYFDLRPFYPSPLPRKRTAASLAFAISLRAVAKIAAALILRPGPDLLMWVYTAPIDVCLYGAPAMRGRRVSTPGETNLR